MTIVHACILITTATLAAAQALETTKGVDLQLISEQEQVAADQPFTVGLRVRHHEGFHTYWQSPGIVGVATNLKWYLPQGFLAGPIQWPTPELIDMAGHPAHGYERDVMLLVEITPPPKLTGTAVTLSADASWMACADACHPGSTRLSISMPVGEEAIAAEDQRAVFAEARKRLPQPILGLKTSSSTTSDTITLRVIPTAATSSPKKAYFFSADGLISSDQPQILRHRKGGGFELQMTVAEFGPKKAERLSGVLCITQQDGSALTGTIAPALVKTSSDPRP